MLAQEERNRCESKLQTPAEQLRKVGGLVWIVEESNPRGYYPTARIEELRYGSDSVARPAIVRTSFGSLVHPLVKLVSIVQTFSSGPEDVTAKMSNALFK